MKWVIPAVLLQAVQIGYPIYELVNDHKTVITSKTHYVTEVV